MIKYGWCFYQQKSIVGLENQFNKTKANLFNQEIRFRNSPNDKKPRFCRYLREQRDSNIFVFGCVIMTHPSEDGCIDCFVGIAKIIQLRVW